MCFIEYSESVCLRSPRHEGEEQASEGAANAVLRTAEASDAGHPGWWAAEEVFFAWRSVTIRLPETIAMLVAFPPQLWQHDRRAMFSCHRWCFIRFFNFQFWICFLSVCCFFRGVRWVLAGKTNFDAQAQDCHCGNGGSCLIWAEVAWLASLFEERMEAAVLFFSFLEVSWWWCCRILIPKWHVYFTLRMCYIKKQLLGTWNTQN